MRKKIITAYECLHPTFNLITNNVNPSNKKPFFSCSTYFNHCTDKCDVLKSLIEDVIFSHTHGMVPG